MTDKDRNVAKATFFSMIRNDPDNDDNRLIFADWCEENQEVELAVMLRGGSRSWLAEYASQLGHHGYDEDRVITWKEVVQAAHAHLDGGAYLRLTYDTPDFVYSLRQEFWKHFEVMTGRLIPDEHKDDTFISCSC